MELTVTNRSRA